MYDSHYKFFMQVINDLKKNISSIEPLNKKGFIYDEYKWKMEHSLRVAELCKIIAMEEEFDDIIDCMKPYLIKDEIVGKYKFNDNGIKIATLCGLYHDIGAFYQLAKYQTDDDLKAPIDHGSLGMELLSNNYTFNTIYLDKQDRKIIESVVFQNDKNYVNDKCSYDVNCFCSIVRDADKIDTLRAVVEEKINVNFRCKDSVNKYVLDSFENKMIVPKKMVNNDNDLIARLFSFYYDINTTSARNILDNDKDFLKLYNKLKHKIIFNFLLETDIVKRGKKSVR